MNKAVWDLRNAQYDALRAHALTLGYTPTYSHETAVVFWGYDLRGAQEPPPPPHHVCFTGRGARRRKTATTMPHAWSGALPSRVIDGGTYRVVEPEVCWAQMAASVDLDTLIAIACFFACRDLSRRVMNLEDAHRYVMANARFKGRRTCLEALPFLVANTDSPPEAAFIVMLLRAGVTDIVPNLKVTLDGRHYYLDAAIERLRIAFEYQGAYHADPRQMRRDAAKHNVLKRHGWEIIYVTADDMHDEASRNAILALVRQVIARQRHLLGLMTPA